jgi:diguanylate cyclase (GGDEF)-like protein
MVEVEQPSIILESSTRKLSRILMSVALLLLLQTILLGLWAIYKVSRPLNILIRSIDDWDAVSSPDFGTLKNRSDEIGTLIRTFIRMSDEIMLKNRLLKDQATRDALTGLYNRRYFDETLRNEWDRHTRGKSSIALIMADIDYFKIYNDTYGHQKGDECLRQVAQTCSSSLLRPGDTSFRYGGEEFAFILTDTGSEGAIAVAQRLKDNVEALHLPHRNKPEGGTVSMSFGVAVSESRNGETAESASDLLGRADKALYKAKETGRNRVISI